jgi:hypothetical protein
MSDRIALYSALYGGYEHAKPLPADLGCPAVLYTDEPDVVAPGWEVRVVTDHVASPAEWERQRQDPAASWAMMAHKYWKCHPTEALPDVDVSMWIDASILIKADRYAERCLEALDIDDWTAVRHPWRDCIYSEAAFSATLARYDSNAVMSQVAFYRQAIQHPEHWGLFATGANVRRHTEVVAEIGSHWWWECINRSHQDQLSLPVLFRMAGEGPVYGPLDHELRWNTNMPWDTWWGVYEHGRP